MMELLPNLEQVFAYIYYPLTGEEYGQLPDDSFIDKAIHAMNEKKKERVARGTRVEKCIISKQ